MQRSSLSRFVSRRTALKSGAAAIAGTTAVRNSALASWKAPGETRVVFLVGDYWHNGVMQEKNWRDVLGKTGWNLLFAQSPRFVTDDVLAQTDLFVVARYEKTNSLGWSQDGLVAERPEETTFLNDYRKKAIIENVHRGMGLLAMHCSIWNGGHPEFLDLLGVGEPHMHTKVQPTRLHKLNASHPITKDVGPQNIGEDEIFSADLIPGRSDVLFNLAGDEQPIDTAGGWCHDAGKGRVTVLLPGHTAHPFHAKSFKQIMWNASHWTMKKAITPGVFADGRPPEK